jgi:hypothetical protein
MKNSNDTIGIRTRALPACSAVPQPTVTQRINSFAYSLDIGHTRWHIRPKCMFIHLSITHNKPFWYMLFLRLVSTQHTSRRPLTRTVKMENSLSQHGGLHPVIYRVFDFHCSC